MFNEKEMGKKKENIYMYEIYDKKVMPREKMLQFLFPQVTQVARTIVPFEPSAF